MQRNSEYLIERIKSTTSINLIKVCKLSVQFLAFILNICNEIINTFNVNDLHTLKVVYVFKKLYIEFINAFGRIIKSLDFNDNIKDIVCLLKDVTELYNKDLKFVLDFKENDVFLDVLSKSISIFNESQLNTSLDDNIEGFDTNCNDTVFQILHNIEQINHKGMYYALRIMSYFCKTDNKYFDNAFSELCDVKFDVQQSSIDFYMFMEIVKILAESTSVRKECLEWIFSYMQKMCKSHFKNSEASLCILDLLKRILPSVNLLQAGATKNNAVIMLSSFIIQCSKNNYGPDVYIKLLDCIKVLAQV